MQTQAITEREAEQVKPVCVSGKKDENVGLGTPLHAPRAVSRPQSKTVTTQRSGTYHLSCTLNTDLLFMQPDR